MKVPESLARLTAVEAKLAQSEEEKKTILARAKEEAELAPYYNMVMPVYADPFHDPTGLEPK